jgi:hypothetical protein
VSAALPCLAPALALLALAGGLPAQDEPWLRIRAGAAEVGFAEAFELRVERGWPEGVEPEVWSDAVLAPLHLELLDLRREAAGGFAIEVRTYRARLLRVGEVSVPGPFFRARTADGGTLIAFGEDLDFVVASALPPGDAGEVELPAEILPAPWSLRRRLAAAAALCGIVAGISLWARSARRAAARPAPPPPAEQVARARLAALAGEEVADREAERRWFVDCASTVRAYLDARLGRGTGERTSEELCREPAVQALGPAAADLDAVLGRCDLVKFAMLRSSAAERRALLEAAERFVLATSPEVRR